MVVVRALAGYVYGLVALLHMKLGEPQERERLEQKDAELVQMVQSYEGKLAQLQRENRQTLAQLRDEHALALTKLSREKDEALALLRQENTVLTAKLEGQNREAALLKTHLSEMKTAQLELQKALAVSTEEALEAYSEECKTWLHSGVKSVSIDEIIHYTGFSKQKVKGALQRDLLQTSARNKELITVASLVEWLKTVQPSRVVTEEVPALRIVQNE